MMEVIKQWAFTVCAAVVVCTVATMILPKSNMEKAFRFTISLFFMLCLLYPIFSVRGKIDFELDSVTLSSSEEIAARLQNQIDETFENTAKVKLQELVGQKLTAMGINDAQVVIHITIPEGEEEMLDWGATIYLKDADKNSPVAQTIEQELGIRPEIVYRT